jgi:hypothetical protein
MYPGKWVSIFYPEEEGSICEILVQSVTLHSATTQKTTVVKTSDLINLHGSVFCLD